MRVCVPIFLRGRVCLPEYTAVFWAMLFLVVAIACGFFRGAQVGNVFCGNAGALGGAVKGSLTVNRLAFRESFAV